MLGLSHEDRKQLRRGALRSYGRQYRFLIVFGPAIAKGLLWVGLLVLAYLGWVKIPHWVLGTAALTIAGAAVLALLAPKLRGVRGRMHDRAIGRTPGGLQLGWAYATLIVVGVGMGWLALWSPLA